MYFIRQIKPIIVTIKSSKVFLSRTYSTIRYRGKRVVVVDETGKGEGNKSESLLIQRAREPGHTQKASKLP